MSNKLTLAAVAVLTLAALVGCILLTALGLAVPDVLPLVVTTGLGGLVGVALPRSGTNGGPSSPDPVPGQFLEQGQAPTALVRRDTGGLLHRRAAA